MKCPFRNRYTGLALALAASLAADLGRQSIWPDRRGSCASCFWLPAMAQEKPATPAQRYATLLKEFQSAAPIHFSATTDAERQAVVARVAPIPPKLLELVEENPRDPIALDVLTQIITQEYWLNTHTSHPGWGKDSPQAKAIALILRDHLDSDKLAEVCKRVSYGFRQECETILRTVLEKSPHREVRGPACLRLAQFLANRRERIELFEGQPDLARSYALLFGNDYLTELKRTERAKVIQEVETLYEQAIAKYGDLKMPFGGTVGEQAERELFEIRHLSVGKEAPEIEGQDQEGQPLKLSSYRGKVVLLYFWSEY